MVPTSILEAEPTKWKESQQDRHSFFLQQACAISSALEENEPASLWSLKLNEDEPWERSLSKLLGDSSSSLYSLKSKPSTSATGIYRLEHTESRDWCSKTDELDEDLVDTIAPTRSFALGVCRSWSAAPRDVALLDSDETSSDTTESPTLYHSRTTSVRSADDGLFEHRQDRDHIGYREIMSRRAQICMTRQRHRDLFSPVHSFDDVRHFTEEIDLPYLPSLDESAGLDDSNTVRRLPPRFDSATSLLGETRMLGYSGQSTRAVISHEHLKDRA